MIINQIVLDNFGLYAGKQVIDLRPPAQNKPIVLIGGLNGGGKTTFLDALQLCLFGGHAKTSGRGTLSYQDYLSRCIHRGNNANEAAIEINFSHLVEGHDEEYQLRRYWKRNGKGCVEEFNVAKNKCHEQFLSENWTSQVNDFFPANIANLFLFDGEQIEAYASLQDSSELIGAAIQNLLGLDMVDQLDKDMIIFDQRKRREDDVENLSSNISITQEAIKKIKKNIQEFKEECKKLETKRVKISQSLNQAETKYRSLGGELYDRKEEIKEKLMETKNTAIKGKQRLIEKASGPLPFQFVEKLLSSAKETDTQEEESKWARHLVTELEQRDKKALKKMQSCSISGKSLTQMTNYFKSERSEISKKIRQNTVLNLNPDTRDDLTFVLNSHLIKEKEEAEILLKTQSEQDDLHEQFQIEFDSIPNPDALAKASEKVEKHKREIEEIDQQINQFDQDLQFKERELLRREQELTKLIEADTNAKGCQDDRKRMLHHASKVRNTLSAFRSAIIKDHVHRIEGLVLESYQILLRKEALVSNLLIDPENFNLTLLDRKNRKIPSEQLSAGERQLLAIALLWGLAKASGRPLPTAIDTPLGRLDSEHRMNLIERYLPYASHQVLLLSTDEEITGKYLETLDPWVGRKYQLCYDDNAERTKITEGYLMNGS